MRNSKKFIYLFTLFVSTLAFAEDDRVVTPRPDYVKEYTRKDMSDGTNQSVQDGDQIQPVFEPGIVSINAQFQAVMDGLLNQLKNSPDFESENAIQEQIMSLKHEWKLARINRLLELARAKKDTEQETELLQAIQALTMPKQRLQDINLLNENSYGAEQGGAK